MAFGVGAVGLLGLGLGLGSASQVTLAASPLGAGAATIASCQGSAPVKVTFTTTYDTADHRYEATAVRLSGLEGCNGRGYRFSVVSTAGARLGNEATGDVASGVTASHTITQTAVAEIARVELVIP